MSDIDRAITLYVEQASFSVEQDVQVDDTHRFVELIPTRIAELDHLANGLCGLCAGVAADVQLNVDDSDQVHAFLRTSPSPQCSCAAPMTTRPEDARHRS